MSSTPVFGNASREDIFARRLSARLSEASNDLPHDITERLRAARVRALAQAKREALVAVPHVVAQGATATMGAGGDKPSVWEWIASVIPLLALLAGLATIAVLQEQNRTRELAELDVQLLVDELPPAAYTDPGFAQFLRSRD